MIRTATDGDLPQILHIYGRARRFMAENGNPDQWGNTFPPTDLLQYDIKKKRLFVLDDGGVHAVFAFILGDDPAYAAITDGAWLSDAPYGTIHRLASDGTVRGVLDAVVAFCAARQPHLRIDTHADNHIMQHLIEKNGFTRCGIVRTVEDNTPRIAYEKQ